jgi:hypothetical protein
MVDATAFQASGTTPYDYTKADLSSSASARSFGLPQTVFSNNLLGNTRSAWNSGAF